MIRHSAALKVLRRGEIIGQTMQPKPQCRRNLRRIARHLRPLHVDMDRRIEESVLTVCSLDGLHDAALTGFLNKKAKGIVHHPPLYSGADGERIHRFELNVIRETEFAERHGERANPPLPEFCVGKRMRDLNPRVCQYMQRLDKLTCCICDSRATLSGTPQRICIYRFRPSNPAEQLSSN